MENILDKGWSLGWMLPLVLVVYFLPSIIAVVLNRSNKKKMFVANIPAGFAFTLWFAVLIWAITGKQKEE